MRHSGQINYRKLCISIAITLAMLVLGVSTLDAITPDCLGGRLGFPLSRLVFFIFIGLTAGQVIEAMGWTREVAIISRPLFRFARIGDHCSAAFTTAFISGAAANAMLREFHDEKKISTVQLFLSNYLNQFPAFFLHLPTTMFIVLPLTGRAGVLYFVLTFAATLFRTVCFLIFGHFYLSGTALPDAPVHQDSPKPKPTPSPSMVIQRLKQKLLPRIVNIMVWVLPIYTLVFILNTAGFFDYLNQALTAHVTSRIMPIQSLSVVILSFAAEFTSGFAAAGALMDAGVITVKQTVIALLLGNVLAFPIRALRHQLPRYMGIFSPKTGLQLLLSGQFFRISSIILAGLIYYMVA